MKKIWWYRYGESLTGQMEAFLDLQFAASIRRRLQGAIRSAGSLFDKRL
jgi:hypothetical protein